jgi:quercetin dioxygenase-like cupin family protein
MEFDRPDPTKGGIPDEYRDCFEGTVRFQAVAAPFTEGPNVTFVHFDVASRTRPHVHHKGQVLHIIAGRGVVADGTGRHVVEVGDTVVVHPDEWHWHGGLPDSAMSHLVVQFPGADLSFDVEERDWAGGYEDL